MAEETTNIDPTALTNVDAEDVTEAIEGQPGVVEEPEAETPKVKNVTNSALLGMMYDDGNGNLDLYNGNDGNLDVDVDQFLSKRLGPVRTTKKLDEFSTFTGVDDTYKRSEEAQGVIGKLSNTFLGFIGDTAINTAQGAVAMFYGAGSAIANGDLTKVFDNTLANALDEYQERFNKQFEVTRGGDQGLVKKGATLIDDFAGALSFVAAAVATEGVLTAATALTGGAAAPVQAAATVGIAARGARILKQLASSGRRFIGKSAVDDALKGAASLGDDATRAAAARAMGEAGKKITAAQRVAGMARVSRQLLTGAGMEAGMEARHMLNEATEERSRAFEKENGREMTEAEKEVFRRNNSKIADATFGVNLALVGIGNMLMFPKLFGLGLRKGMSIGRFIDKSSITNPKQQARIAKAFGKEWKDLPDLLDVQRAKRFAYSGSLTAPLGGRAGRATARSRSALYEGFVEEGGQGTISRTSKDYIAQQYDPDNRQDTLSFQESFFEGLKGSYTTAEGLKEIGLGIAIGYMGLPNILVGNSYSIGVDENGKKIKPRFIGGATEIRRQQQERDKRIDSIVNMVKDNGDVHAILRAELDHSVRMSGLEKQLKQAVQAGDMLDAKHIEAEQVFSFGTAKLLTGRFDDAIAEFTGIVNEQTTEEFREMLESGGGADVSNMSEEEISAMKSRTVQRFTERMNMVRDAYENSQVVYQGEDPVIHQLLAHQLYNISDRDARERALSEEITEIARELSGAEVLEASRLLATLKLDDVGSGLNTLLADEQKLRNIDKQLATKRERGIIDNIDEAKAEKRQQEIAKLEAERQAILDKRAKLEDALSGKFDFNVKSFEERLNTLIDVNEKLIQAGENVAEIDNALKQRDLAYLSEDRLRMIRAYNALLEPGGYDAFIKELVEGTRESLLKKAAPVEQANSDERVHREVDEDDNVVVEPEEEGDADPVVRETEDDEFTPAPPREEDDTDDQFIPGQNREQDSDDDVKEELRKKKKKEESIDPDNYSQKDGKGRTYTYFAETTEKDGVKTTRFTFNRSDKDSTQRNSATVPVQVALGNKFSIDESSIGEAAQGQKYVVVGVKEIREGETGAAAVVRVSLQNADGTEVGQFDADVKLFSINENKVVPTPTGTLELSIEGLALDSPETPGQTHSGKPGAAAFIRDGAPVGAEIEIKLAGGKVVYSYQGNAIHFQDSAKADVALVTALAAGPLMAKVTSAQEITGTSTTDRDGTPILNIPLKQHLPDLQSVQHVVLESKRNGVSTRVSMLTGEVVEAMSGQPKIGESTTGQYLIVKDENGNQRFLYIRGRQMNMQTAKAIVRMYEIALVADGEATWQDVGFESQSQYEGAWAKLQKDLGLVDLETMSAKQQIADVIDTVHGSMRSKDGKNQGPTPRLRYIGPATNKEGKALKSELMMEVNGKRYRLSKNRNQFMTELARGLFGVQQRQLTGRYEDPNSKLPSNFRVLEDGSVGIDMVSREEWYGTNMSFAERVPFTIDGKTYLRQITSMTVETAEVLQTPAAETNSSETIDGTPPGGKPYVEPELSDKQERIDALVAQTQQVVKSMNQNPPRFGAGIAGTDANAGKQAVQQLQEDFIAAGLPIRTIEFARETGFTIKFTDVAEPVVVGGSISSGSIGVRVNIELVEVIEGYFAQRIEAVEQEPSSPGSEPGFDGSMDGAISFSVQQKDDASLLDNAGTLHTVEGFKARDVHDTVNVLAGKVADQLFIHAKTTKRKSMRRGEQIKNNILKQLQAFQKQLETVEQTPVVKAQKAHVAKILEVKKDANNKDIRPTFDRFMELAFFEVLRQLDGNTRVNSKSLTRSLAQLESNPELSAEEINDKRQELGDNVQAEEEAVQREPSALAAFDDNFAFGADPNANMRYELKLGMLRLRHSDNSNQHMPNTMGILGPKFIDFNTVSHELQRQLVGTEAAWVVLQPDGNEDLTANSVKNRLVKIAENMPVANDVLKLLSETDTRGNKKTGKELFITRQMQQQFATWAVKTEGGFITTKLTPGAANEDGTPDAGRVRQFNSMETNMQEFLIRSALQNMVNRGLFVFDATTGKTRISKEKVDEMLAEFDRIASDSKNKARDTARLLYKYFGIQVPASALTNANPDFNGIEEDMSNAEFVNTPLGVMRSRFRKVAAEDNMPEAIDWYVATDENNIARNRGAIELFFGKMARHQQNLIQSVSKDADGKMRYHLHAPKHLVMEMERIRTKDTVSEWDEGNPLVKNIRNPRMQNSQNKVRIDYENGIKNTRSRMDSRVFHDMNEVDHLMARLARFGNDTEVIEGRVLSRHYLPTLADKGTMPTIRVEGLSNRLIKRVKDLPTRPIDQYQVSDFLNVTEYYNEQLKYSVSKDFEQMQARREAGESTAGMILYPQLNALIPDGLVTENDLAQLHKDAVPVITRILDKEFQFVLTSLKGHAFETNSKNEMVRMRYFSTTKETFIQPHIGKQNEGVNSRKAFLAFAAVFVAEGRAVNANALMAFAGRPEAFIKRDKKGKALRTKTLDNLGKRLASFLAPGTAIPIINIPGQKRTNAEIRSLIIDDPKVVAEHIDYMKNKLGIDGNLVDGAYSEIDSADAAVFVTAEEHLSTMLAQGRITEEEFVGVLNKVKKGITLDVDDLAFFQPMKPVYVYRDEDGTMRYIKFAQFPLIPEFTRNFKIDKLREHMENNNLDMAVHHTAFKVGNPFLENPLKIYQDDGSIEIPDNAGDYVMRLPRQGLLIQQETPVGKSADKIHGSQAAKLVMANIAKEDIENFIVNGVNMNGREAFEHYMEARKAERMERRKIFADKYGLIVEESEGAVTIRYSDEYKAKLGERIVEEAMSRGYSTQEIGHLRLDIEANRFRTPLWASQSNQRVNSLIQSIYRKEVIESRIAGFSGPIAPAIGVSFDGLTQEQKQGIVYVGDKFDGKKLRVGVEGKPDQILMPWKFKGKLQKFIDPKTGKLDMDKVPEELLQVFAYRIPNQKKASSGSFEIVGFLPDSMGDTLIVPDELVGRIGQDFDIDKMFGMMYAHKLNRKTGKITIIREGETAKDRMHAARNRQIDVYHASMRNPDQRVQKEIHTPVSDGFSAALASQFDENQLIDDPLGIEYNIRKAMNAGGAKSAIGVMANADVVHAQMEQADLPIYMQKTIKIKTKEGVENIETLPQIIRIVKDESVAPLEDERYARMGKTDLLDTETILDYGFTPSITTTQEQFSVLLNHAVDNENEQLLQKLGINRYTYPFWVHMTNMGYNMETIALFVRQPEVQEIIRLQRENASVDTLEYFDLMETIQEEISELQEELDIDNATLNRAIIGKDKLAIRAGVRQGTLDARDEQGYRLNILNSIKTIMEVDRSYSTLLPTLKMDTATPKNRGELFFQLTRAERFAAYQQQRGMSDYDGPRYAITFDEFGSSQGGKLVLSQFLENSVAGLAFRDVEETIEAVLILDGEHLERTIFGRNLRDISGDLSKEIQTDYFNGVRSYLSAEWAEKLTGKSARELRRDFTVNKETSIARTVTDTLAKNPSIRENLFIRHLQINDVQKNRMGLHTVEFQGDRKINVSDIELDSAFLELAKHPSKEVKQMVRDLVIYDLVMRGTLGSKSFGKFVPAEYLQDLGIQAQFDPNKARFQQGIAVGTNEGMHKQIIQHNPRMAPVVSVSFPEGYTALKSTANWEGSARDAVLGFVRDEKGRLYEVVTLPEGDTPGTVRQVSKAAKTHLYNLYSAQEALPQLDEFSEHYRAQAKSVQEEFTESEETPDGAEGVGLATDPTPVNEMPEAPVVEEKKVEPRGDGQSRTLKDAIRIVKGESNPLLAKMLVENDKLPPNLQVRIVFDYDENAQHSHQAGVITIDGQNASANRLAHEMIHFFTYVGLNQEANKDNRNRLNNIYRDLTTDSAFLSRFGTTKEELKEVIDNYNAVVAPLRENRPATREEAQQAFRYYQAVRANPLLKGLLNFDEFLAESLTNRRFAEALNNIKLDTKGNTLYKRILDIISKVLQDMGILSKVDDGSALAEVGSAVISMMEVTGNEFSNIPRVKPGEQTKLFSLKDVNLQPEELAITDREVLKQYKRARIAELEELRARFANSGRVVADVDARIRLEKIDLRKLEGDDSVDVSVVVEFVKRELRDIAALVDDTRQATTRDERHAYAHARLLNAEASLAFYSKSEKLLDGGIELKNELIQLQGAALSLRTRWMDVSAEILQNYARARYRGTEMEKLIDGNTFRNMDDIATLRSMFMDLSRQGRVELSYLDGVIRDSIIRQRDEWVQLNDEHRKRSAKFKETAYFKKYGWNGLVKGEREEQTAEGIGPISVAWDKEFNARRAEARQNKNWKGFFAWMKANTVRVPVTSVFDLSGERVVRKGNIAVQKKLEEQLGKAAAAELLDRQEILAQQFLDARRAAFDLIEIEESSEAAQTAAKQKWLKANGFNNASSPFVYAMPLRTKNGKTTGWHDSRYQEMLEEKDAIDFYNFHRAAIRELTAALPRHNMSNHQIMLMERGLFVPAVQRSLTKQIWQSENKVKALSDAAWASVTTKIDKALENMVDPVTGEVRRSIPTHFLREVEDRANQEFDLDKNFAIFSMMATTYKHKNLVEDEVRMIEAVLGEVGINHRNGLGQRVKNAAGALMASNTQEARANVSRSVRAAIEGFYGRRSNVEGKFLFGKQKARTEEEKKRERDIQSRLDDLKSDYDRGAIVKSIYEAEKEKLEGDLAKVGSRIDGAKVVRNFVTYMQMKGMGWNVVAAKVNAIFGTMQVFKHAAGRKDFDENEARKAFGVMLHSTLNMVTLNTGVTKTDTSSKIQNLMINLNVLKDFTEIQFDASKADVLGAHRKGINKLRIYEIQRSSEYFTYGHVMVSHLLNQKVDGKSLWELTDENGIIQAEGYRPGEEKYIKLIQRIDQINKRIHGNYDPDSIMPIKQTLLGPMLMQFRSWVPEGLASRYESERFDPLLNRNVKGTVRAVLEGDVETKMRKLANLGVLIMPLVGRNRNLDQFSEADQEGMRKFAASIRQMMWVYLMVAALRAMDDDNDDPEAQWMFNYGLNLASRVNNDLNFFNSIRSQRQLTNDILPVAGVIDDVLKFSQAVGQTMMGDGTVPTGIYAGESRMWIHGSKLLPHTEAYQRMVRNMIQQMDKN